MKKKFSIVLTMVILALAGCYYNPSGEHFEELDQTGHLPYVEVELNFDTDTLYISSDEWIYFHYTKNGDQVNWARFIVDGEETSPNNEQQGGIELRWYFLASLGGEHTLSLQLFTHSGTGSIADKSSVEGFLMQKDWILKVVDEYEMGPSIVDSSFQNGLLKLTWEEYKGPNFESYQIYKWVQPTALPDQLVATITDQHQTSVTDPNYHGENSMYYVRVNDRYRGNSLQTEGPLPAVNATNNAQGDIVLHWQIPKFWAALKGYRILDDDISWTNTGFIPLCLIDKPRQDSIIIPDPYFAHEYDFWLQLDPKGTAYLENWSRPVFLATRTKASYGAQSPKFAWAQTGIENKIYLLVAGTLNIYDTETLKISVPDNIPALFRFQVSANNRYLAGRGSTSNNVFLFDLKHPENNKTINMDSKLPDFGHLVSVSDKGTGIVLSGQKAVLYDYINEQVLAEKQLPYNGLYRNHLSGDGNYFTLDTYGGYNWYTCENNTITEMANIKNEESGTLFSDFVPGEATQLLAASSAHVSVYDCKTQQLLHRWEFASDVETTVYHVVKSSGKLFISEGEDLVLLDLKTGERTFLGKTTNNNKWSLVFNNGQILWSEGRRLDVSAKL